MKKELIEEKVKDVLVNTLDCDERDINEGTHIGNDLGADSLDFVEILINIESKFNIHITDEEADTIRYFNEIVELVDKKLKEQRRKKK